VTAYSLTVECSGRTFFLATMEARVITLGLDEVMNVFVLQRAFARMGARVQFSQLNRRTRLSGRIASEELALDARRDQQGECFLISRPPESTTELVVLMFSHAIVTCYC